MIWFPNSICRLSVLLFFKEIFVLSKRRTKDLAWDLTKKRNWVCKPSSPYDTVLWKYLGKCQKLSGVLYRPRVSLVPYCINLFVIRIVAKILCTVQCTMLTNYNCSKTKQSPFPLLKNRATRIVIWNYRTYFRPANEINVVLRIVYGISKCNNNVLYGVCIRVLKLFDVLVIPKFERKEYQGDDEQKKLLVRYTVIY